MANLQPLVLMMAGGTGGHVYPALAVASELLSRGYRVEWVGTRRGLEHRVVTEANIPLHLLPVRGVRGKGLPSKLAAVFFLLLSAVSALWLVLRRAPACVVGMGGYVAGPAGVAAWLLRKPLLIHEQNAVAGTTNRMLAPLASTVACGFPGAFRADVETRVLGNPVRAALIEAAEGKHYDYAGQRPLRLLVLGGSLGARPINEALPPAVCALLQGNADTLEVWHQTGAGHDVGVRSAYGEWVGQGVKVAPFIEDMAAAYDWADLVLCRAGALTIAELGITGRPSILVPLPQAIDDHQNANARSLTDSGAAVLLPQSQMTADSLQVLLAEQLANPQRLADMAMAARAAGNPEAATRVADCCEELIHGR